MNAARRATIQKHYDPVARALTHHGIAFKLVHDEPHGSRGAITHRFIVETTVGTKEMTLRDAQNFCLGLAAKEQLAEARS